LPSHAAAVFRHCGRNVKAILVVVFINCMRACGLVFRISTLLTSTHAEEKSPVYLEDWRKAATFSFAKNRLIELAPT